jgi:DNA-binding NarL/FixJ family response regulator
MPAGKQALRPHLRRDRRRSLRVLIADRWRLLLDLLTSELLRRGYTVVGAVENGRRAVELAGERRPHVALLDVSMPVLGGVEAARQILHVAPRTSLVLLAEYAEEGVLREALSIGVRGFLPKAVGVRELVRAVREVRKGRLYVSPCYTGVVAEACGPRNGPGAAHLTARELQTLTLIAEGKTTKQAAGALTISVRTAEWYRAQLMGKLRIHDTAGLVHYAIRHGVIPA